MRYVAAYLLAALGGNEHPTVANIESILGSVGVDVDATKAKLVVEKLKGKSIAELIAAGSDKLAAVVSAGAAAPAAAASKAAAPAAEAAEKKEDKKKKEEPAEEEDEDMGFGLFD